MKTYQFKFYVVFGILLFLKVGIAAQTDSLWLKDGTLKVGAYKVSYNKQLVEGKLNSREVYKASNVLRLVANNDVYANVRITADGSAGEYLAKRLMDSQLDLYGVDFPAGYFNENSVAQSFYYFEKGGVMTYINKANLEAFYSTYFGSCYGWIVKKSLIYNENSIVKMLNAYNKCINPNSKEQLMEPVLKVVSIYAHGGIHRLTHEPNYIAYEDGDFQDKGKDFGLGLNFEHKSKLILGFEFDFSKHTVESPTIRSYLNPGIIISDFNRLGGKLICAYRIGNARFAIKPGLSVGFSKMLNYRETRIKPIVATPPFNADFFTFKRLFNDFMAFTDINYHLSDKFALFARIGYAISLTTSRAGFNYFPDPSPEGNLNVHGGILSLGIQYSLKQVR